MKRAMAVLLVCAAAAAATAQVSEGDHEWSMRAEGSANGRARPEHVNAALAAYQRAISADPNNLEPHWKLLRAYRFKGAYVAATNDEKKLIYGQAKEAGQSALALLDRRLREKGIASPEKADESKVAEAAKSIPGAGETYLWDAINWGEWALAYGKLAAARQGAADRIRREAMIANLIDPRLEGGSPTRVLGRLYNQTPRIPFITGWASDREAVKFLRESMNIDPANKITIVFLAEAMVANDGRTKSEAVQMLKNAVNAPVDPNYVVEQTAALNDAKNLLRRWGA